MPTTRTKNMLYRLALPFLAPKPDRHPDIRTDGHALYTLPEYERLIRKHHVLGSSAIVSSGKESSLILSSSRNPEHIATPGTFYRVASITKMATTLCVLSCCEKGILDLDRPIADFFPEEHFDPRARRITGRHLLSHTGGLIDPPDLENSLLKRVSFPQILNSSLCKEPGDEFHYSNLGFGLLGCILEALTNQTVCRTFDDLVFSPLHMNATLEASTVDPEKIMPVVRILPYHPDKEVRTTKLGAIPLDQPDPLYHYGHTAGSMYTDIGSLYVLLDCIRNAGKPLLRTGIGAEMSKQHASYGGLSPTLSYGLGLLIIQDSTISESRVLGHQGFAYGCADGAFWEEDSGNMLLFLNGGCSEARNGRLGQCNYEMLIWALRKELPAWSKS